MVSILIRRPLWGLLTLQLRLIQAGCLVKLPPHYPSPAFKFKHKTPNNSTTQALHHICICISPRDLLVSAQNNAFYMSNL